MAIDVTLPHISEDEAYNALVSALHGSAKQGEKISLLEMALHQKSLSDE